MTWGQLRFQLQTTVAGVPIDLLDEYLNGRYEQVLEATDWKGLKYRTTVQTTAAYQSAADTVTFTVGSVNVVGLGTAWVTGQTGLQIYRPGDTVVYTFTWVTATAGTLDRPYEGIGTDAPATVYAKAAYVLMQDIYPLPADVRSLVAVGDPTTGFLDQYLSLGEMENSCGPRTLVENPTAYALYDDSDENVGPVVHQVRLYPPPLYARGIPVEYIHTANSFDGSNTSSGPLPWITQSVLLYGCRADLHAYLAAKAAEAGDAGVASVQLDAAKLYESKYGAELQRLLLVEHAQRRKIVAVKMAGRFTRHRLARTARGTANSWRGGTPGGPD